MELSSVLTIAGPILLMGIILFFVFKFKKREPITYAEYFIKDKDSRFIHILGAKRVMPEDGDSFDIYEHYVFVLNENKFVKGGSQRGNNLDLRSEFVKRSMQTLSEKLNAKLAFVLPDADLEEEEEGVLKVYQFEDTQSDTELAEELNNDNLTFIKNTSTDNERFTMIICRHGRELKRYNMQGMSDYFFKTIYLEDKLQLCFLYRKQKTMLMGGMALCIINYETGDMLFDGFVRE